MYLCLINVSCCDRQKSAFDERHLSDGKTKVETNTNTGRARLIRRHSSARLTVHFKHEMIEKLFTEISLKIRIKWNFELTVFELPVPNLYILKSPESLWLVMLFWTSNRTEALLLHNSQISGKIPNSWNVTHVTCHLSFFRIEFYRIYKILIIGKNYF